MSSPKRDTAYDFPIELVDSATGDFRINPTLAIGDVKIKKDYGAAINLSTLPTIEPAGSSTVKISISAAEQGADKVQIQFKDVSGNEWDDVTFFIDNTDANVDDIVRSTTPINTLDVALTGEAGVDWANVKDASTTVDQIVSGVWGAQMASFNTNLTFGSGINKISEDFYAANIKYIRDTEEDDYGISWIKNSIVLASGDVTNPAFSVYTQDDGVALFIGQKLNYTAHIDPLLLKHTETTNIQTSGNLYRVITSGTIDGQNREWAQIVGIDLL